MASNYIFPTRDLKFILKEWLDMGKVFAFKRYQDYYSLDDIDNIIDQMDKICVDLVAPTNDDGEAVQARFDGKRVTIPPSYHRVYRFLNQEGWGIANLGEDTEGALPQTMYSALNELITAANPAFVPYLNLSGGVSELIESFGKEWDKETILLRMFTGEWSGTMCLTEAGGGSDVGDVLTKACPTDEAGIYRIKGSKVFITAGDHDMCENIIHMTLARIEGGAPGTKGISLFIVPKVWINPDGSLGEPNDVTTVGIEHKMGIKGSSTAVLNFGENEACRGILMGQAPGADGLGQGMAQMFQMMNGARMDTGHAGLSLAAEAYYNAADYARNRVQGRAYGKNGGPRVPIIQHADIRRMLLNMKASTEAMRAMIFRTYYQFDVMRHSGSELERQIAADRIEVATPLVKAYCSDMAWPLIAEAIQVYGGYGYSEEYPVAQLARDCKIYSLWEGTNYIQSMDLVGRKWTLNKGSLFEAWLDEVKQLIARYQAEEGFAVEADIMNQAMGSYQRIKALIKELTQSAEPAMLPLYATRILHATAQLYCGALILDQAVLAAGQIKALGPDHYDFAFYQGKVESARFYINNVVPSIFTLEQVMMTADRSALNIPEAALGM